MEDTDGAFGACEVAEGRVLGLAKELERYIRELESFVVETAMSGRGRWDASRVC